MKCSQFKVGDRLRVLSIPQSVFQMPLNMRSGVGGTLTAFQYLLERNDVHEVVEVDADRGWPWIEFEILEADGIVHFHKLMIEPECVEIIQEGSQ